MDIEIDDKSQSNEAPSIEGFIPLSTSEKMAIISDKSSSISNTYRNVANVANVVNCACAQSIA